MHNFNICSVVISFLIKHPTTLVGKPLYLTNDGAPRVTSSLFNLTPSEDNIWGEPPRPDKAITQGWWIMLKPLCPREHTSHNTTGYKDSRSDLSIPQDKGNTASYMQDVTYHLQQPNDTAVIPKLIKIVSLNSKTVSEYKENMIAPVAEG